jgi:hypothetical protein
MARCVFMKLGDAEFSRKEVIKVPIERKTENE